MSILKHFPTLHNIRKNLNINLVENSIVVVITKDSLTFKKHLP